MHVKTIKRPTLFNRVEIIRERGLVNIAIMTDDDIKLGEVILRRDEIEEINKWVNK